jgi:holo-[acyl-carrier-protein] synthase
VSRNEVGVDLVDIDRIVSVLGRFPDRFRNRILTRAEDRYCRGRPEKIAGRWAAKEAVSKVLGLGVRGVGWREIEILPNRAGQPQVLLHDRAAARAADLALEEVTARPSTRERRSWRVSVPRGPAPASCALRRPNRLGCDCSARCPS